MPPALTAIAATALAAFDIIDAMDPGRSRAVALACALLVAPGCASTSNTSADEAGDDRAAPTVLVGAPAGTVPSVFGHTRDTAETLLREAGAGRTRRQAGQLRPSGSAGGDRAGPRDGGAAGRLRHGPAGPPGRHHRLRGRPARPVTGTEPGADAARGGGVTGAALDVLSRAAEQVLRVGDAYRMPQLQVVTGTPPDTWCGVARPREVAGREALTLTIDFAEVTATPRCPARVALYETAGAIDTVVAWSEGARGDDLEPIPDAVGLSLAEARDRVTAAGCPARVEELETCRPRRGVVEQAPTQSALEQDAEDDPGWYGPVTLVVEVPHTVRDCAALDAAARGFVTFARGGPPLAWAPEVEQLLGYTPWATVTTAAADDPSTWALCSGSAAQDCDVSPLVVAGRDVEIATGEFTDVARLPDSETCELKARYDVGLVLGDGAHSSNHPGVLLPDALRWLWR